MRPNASPDPAVETLEELADVGAFVIFAPTPQEWIKPRNQFLGSQRCRPFGAFPYLIHETTNRLLLGICVERILSGLTTNLVAGQIKLPPPTLDFVAEELEAVSDMNNLQEQFGQIAHKFHMRWRLAWSVQRPRMAIFVSRYQHCLLDLLHRHQIGKLAGEIAMIISNHPDAEPLASFYKIPFYCFPGLRRRLF
jgi:hypothetical protein